MRKIILAAILPVAAVFAYFSTVPMDISDRIPAMHAVLSPNLYGKLEMSRAKLTLLPRPTVYIEGFALTSKDDDLIRAGSLKATLHPLPLLFGKYVIKKMTITDAEIFVKRYVDGSLNIDKVVKKRVHDIELKRLSIKNSSLKVVDATPGEEVRLAFFDFGADIYESSTGYTYKTMGDLMRLAHVDLSGDANREDGGWRLSGSFMSENLDVALFEPYLKKKRPDLDVAGRVDVDSTFSMIKDKATVRGKVGYRNLTVALSDVYRKEVNSQFGSAVVDATLDADSFRLALDDARVTFDDFVVTGSAQIGGPPEDPLIKLKLASSPVDYYTFKKLLPMDIFPPKVAGRLDAFDVKEGAVAIKDLVIAGRRSELKGKEILTDPEKFSFTLNFSNLDFKYPAFDKTFSNVFADVSLRGRDIFVDGLKGLYGKTAVIDSLKGEILGLGDRVSYSLKINGSFDAIEHLDEMKRFVKELRPITADGVVGVDVTLAKRDGKGFHSGEFSFNGNTLRHDSIPLTFTGSKGRATFDSSRVNFLSLKGQNQGSDVVMDGSIDVAPGKDAFYRLKLRGNITGPTIATLLKKKQTEALSLDAPAVFSLALNGTSAALDADAALDLTQAAATYENLVKKAKGFPSSISGAFKVSKNKATIQNADLRLGGSTIKLKGNFYLDAPLYALDLFSNDLRAVDMDGLLPFLKDDPGSAGSASFSLKAIKESANKPTAWNGKLSVTGGVFLTPFLRQPVEDLNFSAKFNARACDVKLESLKVGESSASGSVSFPDISRNKASFDLYSPNLRVEDIEGPPENNAKPVGAVFGKNGAPPKPKQAVFSASGKLGVAKGNFQGRPFRALTADVSLDQRNIKFDALSVQTDVGYISGILQYITDKRDPVLYRTDLRLKNLDIALLAESLGAKERFISGNMDGVIKLEAKRNVGKEGLNGEVSVKSTDGKLWKFVVISKIFSLVNIFSIDQMFKEGLDYDDISGSFAVKDGIAHTEDFAFASRSLRMSAVGDINLSDSSMDATLGFHPFVTIDSVVSKIPIAGWIITGDNKSTVSMYYKVTGPIKDPVVEPLSVQSMGKNIFGVLQRVLEAPAKAILPKEDFDKLRKPDKQSEEKAK